MTNKDDVKKLYGYCLNLSGITDADKMIDTLLDVNNNLFFSHYVPNSWFDTFASDFIDYAKKLIKLGNWDVNIKKIQKPKRNQLIADHYSKAFLPAFNLK